MQPHDMTAGDVRQWIMDVSAELAWQRDCTGDTQRHYKLGALLRRADEVKDALWNETTIPERQTLAVPFEVARDAVELVRAQAEALEWLVKHIHAGRAFYRGGGWRDFEHYSDARLEATQKKAAVWRALEAALAVAPGEEKGEGHR